MLSIINFFWLSWNFLVIKCMLIIRLVRYSQPVVGKMTIFDLWTIPGGGGAWGAGTNMWHSETPASYESLWFASCPSSHTDSHTLDTLIWGEGAWGGSDIRSMSCIRPKCKCRCPPLSQRKPSNKDSNSPVPKSPTRTGLICVKITSRLSHAWVPLSCSKWFMLFSWDSFIKIKEKLARPPVYYTGSNEPIVIPPNSNGRKIYL